MGHEFGLSENLKNSDFVFWDLKILNQRFNLQKPKLYIFQISSFIIHVFVFYILKQIFGSHFYVIIWALNTFDTFIYSFNVIKQITIVLWKIN